ncbi:hypothetical protein GYMLUDRAFT_240473 [Collybiopsis luxurians FD-317 M1]|nr:hypothetical protein GYMLUDRAFT_240473 [Collybiopsis luxurians FD-317 M1]
MDSDNLDRLPSLRCTDFEPEEIFHPGRHPAETEDSAIVSPQKRPRTQWYPNARRKHVASGKANRRSGFGSSSNLRNLNLDTELNKILAVADEVSPEARREDIENQNATEFVKYVEAVQSECVGFIRLHCGLFAVEGWTKELGQGNRHWYHLEVLGQSVERRASCLCPAGAWYCFHKRYYALYGNELEATIPNEEGPYPTIILFLKESLGFEGNQAIHLFSVSKSGDSAIGISERAIVKHEGSDTGNGTWKCSSQNKDGQMCGHILTAQKFMKGTSDEVEGSQTEKVTGGVDIWDKSCPSCGDYPDSIIWDGVSISFGRKHVNTELQPPTVIQEHASEQPNKPLPHQEWLQDGKMRKRLRDWFAEGGLKADKGDVIEDHLLDLKTHFGRVKMLQLEIYPWLHSLDPHLWDMFSRRLGHGAVESQKGWNPRKEYLVLFQIFAAEESTMQAMTLSTLNNLKIFVDFSTRDNLQLLLGVPSLYTILELEQAKEGRYAIETLGVARWMYNRGKEVLNALLAINSIPLGFMSDTTLPISQMDKEIQNWEKDAAMGYLKLDTDHGIPGYLMMVKQMLARKELGLVENFMRLTPRNALLVE